MIAIVLLVSLCVYAIPEIVGGHPVDPPFKYPWLASIQSFGRQYCGGILLDAKTLLTAAHCSGGSMGSRWAVHAHRYNQTQDLSTEDSIVYEVTKRIKHPLYNSTNYRNDVALWQLKLVSGDPSIISFADISLDNGEFTLEGTELVIAGWGTTESGGSVSSIMLQASVPVSSEMNCKKAYPDIHESSICAGYQQGGIDTCQGDSGGPLFTQTGNKTIIVGLTSYGYGCAVENYPGVYTRVSAVSDWIRGEMARTGVKNE